MEIERKFLVNEVPDLDEYVTLEVTQQYVSIFPEVRLRAIGEEYHITFKSDGTMVREEVSFNINEVDYDKINNLIRGSLTISKSRYYIPGGLYIYELDVYHDELDGLCTIEVEFDTREEASEFNPPEWFGEEVTNDDRYKNKNLAYYGLPFEDQ